MGFRLPVYDSRVPGEWHQEVQLPGRYYLCGHCGANIASERGYRSNQDTKIGPIIYICGGCNRPSFFYESIQIPSSPLGASVMNLPPDIQTVYEEARQCCSVQAYTSSVLVCRKLIMHVAVNKSAKENQSFAHYVDYLADQGYVPPDGKAWVNRIRTQGNEATHEIVVKSLTDAQEVLGFVEMLLKFIFEFPARIGPSQ